MQKITLALTGDVMLGRLVNNALPLDGYSYVWGNVLSLIKDADISLINLECVISEKGSPVFPKVFHFRAQPDAIKALKAAGIGFVSLANNHVLDYGEEALLEMLDLLERNTIACAGAGRNIEGAMRPAILERNGTRVAIISLTDNEPGWEAAEDKAGVNYVPLNLEGKYLERVEKSIKDARGKADYVIVSCHAGPHMRAAPSQEFKGFARKLIDSGADLYWGHSNHVFQGIEIYNGKPILYDTGDFIDDYAIDPVQRNDLSFLFLIALAKARIEKIELVPVAISNMQANLAVQEREMILEKMQKLCKDMGTQTDRVNGRMAVAVD